MLPFAVSIALLSLIQGALVALPAGRGLPAIGRLRGRGWALIPPASIAAVILALSTLGGSAHALTVLALLAVPPLAAAALGWLVYGAHPVLAVLVGPQFALAWLTPHSLVGELATLALCGLSCVTLGTLLAAVTPARWLQAGIVSMALIDAALVISDLLARPNSTLNRAAPGGGLPQLQRVVLGSAGMGYGDLFVAGALGALLAHRAVLRRPAGLLGHPAALQCRAALLTAALALTFDLLFLVVSELPATVPVALALVALEVRASRARGSATRRTTLVRRAGGLEKPSAAGRGGIQS